MPASLLRFPLADKYPEPRMFRVPDRLLPSYDAVIVGGGGHGLAAAYYLARDFGVSRVAVIEKGYLGGGNTGRNTAIVRSNYLTPEGVAFYDESLKLFRDLSSEFDLNLFYSTRGHFTLAHSDASLRTMRWRAEVNKHFGVDSELVGPEFVKNIVPISISPAQGTRPFSEPCGILRAPWCATTRSRGATRVARTAAASRSIRTPK